MEHPMENFSWIVPLSLTPTDEYRISIMIISTFYKSYFLQLITKDENGWCAIA